MQKKSGDYATQRQSAFGGGRGVADASPYTLKGD
jgi:hypothetical protein